MKTLKTLTSILILALLSSCGGGLDKQPATEEGFTAIEKEIKSKFGGNPYLTDLSITYDASIGNTISVTVTEDPSSLSMGQWNNAQGTWTQNSEITLEVPEGSEAKDFMFQLGDKISLKKLGELVEKSKKKLIEEKDLTNPKLSIAFISFPDNGEASQAQYLVNLEPENGGTTFYFYYALNGDLNKLDY